MSDNGILAWAIKAPRGIILESIGIYEQGVISDFVESDFFAWEDYKKQGYRCVRVRIVEMRE